MASQAVNAAASGTWTLGDLTVNRVGFGAMRLPQNGEAFRPGSPPSDRAQALAVLRRAVELGVNHIDTAAFYFSALRSANELINTALAPYPDDLVIVTKVGPGRDPSGDWQGMATPAQLCGQVEENLRQLGRDHLDVVNLRIIRLGSIAEHFGALAGLRSAGLVRHLGLSGVQPHHLAEAQAIAPVVCVQNAYGLGFRRREDEMLRICGEQGVAFVPFFALAGVRRESGAGGGGGGRGGDSRGGSGSGGSGGEGYAEPEDVLAVARAHGVTPAQVRLAWTLSRGPHVLAIPGTGSPEHLAENVAAGALQLTEDELARLEPVHRAG